MTVLRSREIFSKCPSESRKCLSSPTIDPSTPAKQREGSNPTVDSILSSPADKESKFLGLGFDSSLPLSSSRRRSPRIASKMEGFDSEKKSERKPISRASRVCDVTEENVKVLGSSEEKALKEIEMDSMDEDNVRVLRVEEKSRVLSEENVSKELEFDHGGDGIVKNGGEGAIDEKERTRNSKRKGKRKSGVNLELSLGLMGEQEDEKGFLNLRSGARILKRRIEEGGSVDSDAVVDGECRSGDGATVLKIDSWADPIGSGSSVVRREGKYSKREKGKGVLIDANWLSMGSQTVKIDVDFVGTEVVKEEDHSIKNVDSYPKELNKLSVSENIEELAVPKKGGRARASRKGTTNQTVRKRGLENGESARRTREMFRSTAREHATKFAHFNADEEELDNGNLADVPEDGIPFGEEAEGENTEPEIEDWPGPFSTAMNIIRDRAEKLGQRGNSTMRVSKSLPFLKWVPSKDHVRTRSAPLVPTLQDLCIGVLHKNAEEIPSLEGVPDALRHKLSRLLCDSRKMGCHFLGLLFNGSPTEIRLKDSSWVTEEQIEGLLQECKTDQLRVLQLDLCGRCMPDYVLRATLARSPNNLPALTTLSLRGACRLSDVGLNVLISSAPLLRSINLGQCSLLTSAGINSLADKLGSKLRELYLDDCLDVDAMLILPALKKLNHLEVLSVGGIQTICDKFVRELIPVCGPNMKELVFTDCGKLTDASLQVIGQYCSGLHALDLVNLQKLTDIGIQHIANGCRLLQKLKLRRNAFSDEAIAAFLEASGVSLVELSLNNVKEASHNTAIAIAGCCSKTLLSLDLSFCRNMTDEALGLIVDNCLLLRVLKLFGCTQITDVFLKGHSNPLVQLIGLKMGPILEHLDIMDSPYGTLRYSSE